MATLLLYDGRLYVLRELFEVIAVAYAIVAESGAEAPDFGDD
jgi:hypothetical protein